jgi:UDP-N-acetylglucosamine 2-epimerase (non-hydrolysing)
VPCLTLRQNTERPVTVTKGTNRIIGQDPEKILAATEDILAGHEKKRQQPDLWDGHAAEHIVEILKREFPPGERNIASMPTRREG